MSATRLVRANPLPAEFLHPERQIVGGDRHGHVRHAALALPLEHAALLVSAWRGDRRQGGLRLSVSAR